MPSLPRSPVLSLLLSLVLSLIAFMGLGLGATSPAIAGPSSVQPAGTPTVKPYDQLQFPPLPAIRLPNADRFELKNGLVVYLVEDHELPLVKGTAMIRTGSRWEPAEKVGLAELTGSVWRAGGTTRHSAEAMNQFLEQRAASIETEMGTSAATVRFSSLSEDLDPVLERFAEVIRQPAFEPSRFELAKSQAMGALARRDDDPGEIAERELDKLIYGATSPYGRTVEPETLERIRREDLVEFHRTTVFPNRMLLGLVGDFDAAAMRSRLEVLFGDWPPTRRPLPRSPLVRQAKRGQVFLVDQPQLNQSDVRLAHLGGLLSSPDYPALSVLNGVLNGFGGRLVNEVRSRQGLAYSVYAYWSPGFDYPGTFVAGAQTRSAATVPLIETLRAEIEKIRTQPISEAQLRYAKESTLNSFVFNFQDPGQTLSRLMRYEYFGYPKDFIFQYQKAVEATTAEDILRVAKIYLKPEDLVTLVVGNSQGIQPPLSQLTPRGKVIQIPLKSARPNQTPGVSKTLGV